MIKDGVGGNTTLTGLVFENKVDLISLLDKEKGYSVVKSTAGHNILFNDEKVARCFKKHNFYKFLDESNIDHKNILSKKLLPDDALLVTARKRFLLLK